MAHFSPDYSLYLYNERIRVLSGLSGPHAILNWQKGYSVLSKKYYTE